MSVVVLKWGKMLHDLPNHETLSTVSKAFTEIADNCFFFFFYLTLAEPYLVNFTMLEKALEKNVRK